MNASIFETRKIISVARLAVLAAALALAACETAGTGPTAADAPKAEVASARPDAAAPKAEAPKSETAKPQAAKPAEPVADSEPMTHARAARDCWMKTEKANAHTDLDKRADLVNKCIDEKMKAAGIPTPKT
jgi:predicted cobalt transporter CbtA